MRVAVCISGQLRTGLKCLANQKLFYGSLSPDFFVHTWTTNTNKRFQQNETTIVPQKILDKYFAELQPKAALVEDAASISLGSNGKSFHALFYSWAKSVELKQAYEVAHRIKYDYVLKIRPDLILRPGRVLMTEIHAVKKTNSFLVENLLDEWEELNCTDDVMWVASNEHMDTAIQYYYDLVKATIPSNRGLGPELKCLAGYLKMKGIASRGTAQFGYAIYRKECEPLDPITQYEKCRQADWNFFGLGLDLQNAPGWVPKSNESPDYYT